MIDIQISKCLKSRKLKNRVNDYKNISSSKRRSRGAARAAKSLRWSAIVITEIPY